MTAVQEGHDERRRDRLVERGIIEQDGGRLAAQLERDALHGRRAVAHDSLAHGHRAGERDLRDVGVAHELGADDCAEARDHVAGGPSGVSPRAAPRPALCVCSELSSLGLMTTVQPAATAEASLRQMNSAFAFHAVIRPATPTGSRVTRRLVPAACQRHLLERLFGGRERVDAGLHDEPGELDDASVLLDHRGRQIVDAR